MYIIYVYFCLALPLFRNNLKEQITEMLEKRIRKIL